ncbi:hypothetical protein M427DRAFT_52160 [Gonapodya prolifera JEL478]|uniref:Uncharacterized protein n=1 Tax=Gonapodya prolifera (strain JEL478) TaxID=1344416 RepID=A0A139AV08_GONPJ|nr:hypothetical protein M427DRAFT_52160 [Gonapodya prolifera JEL478]|eukprot:KXS20562.1 hypothetical protein M427DRAFT_52160 [Gonapodya prolifera JEL478]
MQSDNPTSSRKDRGNDRDKGGQRESARAGMEQREWSSRRNGGSKVSEYEKDSRDSRRDARTGPSLAVGNGLQNTELKRRAAGNNDGLSGNDRSESDRDMDRDGSSSWRGRGRGRTGEGRRGHEEMRGSSKSSGAADGRQHTSSPNTSRPPSGNLTLQQTGPPVALLNSKAPIILERRPAPQPSQSLPQQILQQPSSIPASPPTYPYPIPLLSGQPLSFNPPDPRHPALLDSAGVFSVAFFGPRGLDMSSLVHSLLPLSERKREPPVPQTPSVVLHASPERVLFLDTTGTSGALLSEANLSLALLLASCCHLLLVVQPAGAVDLTLWRLVRRALWCRAATPDPAGNDPGSPGWSATGPHVVLVSLESNLYDRDGRTALENAWTSFWEGDHGTPWKGWKEGWAAWDPESGATISPHLDKAIEPGSRNTSIPTEPTSSTSPSESGLSLGWYGGPATPNIVHVPPAESEVSVFAAWKRRRDASLGITPQLSDDAIYGLAPSSGPSFSPSVRDTIFRTPRPTALRRPPVEGGDPRRPVGFWHLSEREWVRGVGKVWDAIRKEGTNATKKT